MSDTTDYCPACESSAFDSEHTGSPGSYWCENCEREFWQEGGDWFSCGIDSDPELVAPKTAQDGASET